MTFKFRQKEFDDVKWYDSVVAGEDRCGTYDFCVKCDKEQKYPCARAEYRYVKKYIRLGVISRQK